MRYGVMLDTSGSIDDVIKEARWAAEGGLSSVWSPQIFGYDALTLLAVVGREVDGIELGTAVVPTYPRHPIVLAGQALTTQAASGGRLALGIGLSHRIVIESMFGHSFDIYGQLPSYRAMLDREGAEGPADVAIVGDQDAVASGLTALFDAGATEVVAAPYGSAEERKRTADLLTSLARR